MGLRVFHFGGKRYRGKTRTSWIGQEFSTTRAFHTPPTWRPWGDSSNTIGCGGFRQFARQRLRPAWRGRPRCALRRRGGSRLVRANHPADGAEPRGAAHVQLKARSKRPNSWEMVDTGRHAQARTNLFWLCRRHGRGFWPGLWNHSSGHRTAAASHYSLA